VIIPDSTRMFREAAEAPLAVREQLRRNASVVAEAGAKLRELAPRAVVTCARGSSDHAATFAKYLIETRAGVLTSSAAPSVSSVYAAKADLQGTLFLAVSQSGASPDLVATAAAARNAGSYVIALVNAEGSPLSQAAHLTLPLCAGSETSVAATKSYIASLAAIVHLVGHWQNDEEMLAALELAPVSLARAWGVDWTRIAAILQPVTGLYVVGRGLGLGVAQEAALKLKETCGLHAEAFSSAEVRHGPMALVTHGFPVMLFAQSDETRAGVEALAIEMAARGASVMLAGSNAPRASGATSLTAMAAAAMPSAVGARATPPSVASRDGAQTGGALTSSVGVDGDAAASPGVLRLETVAAHPAIEPMLFVQSFYRAANALSIARGRDPDRPPNLSKVTETV
jgi:glucosamine--fructose-6-phosphate aminotransferase (isomerizing)